MSAIWSVFRLALAAYQADVSLLNSGQLIGLPNYQGLLESLHQSHWNIKNGEILVPDMQPVRPETLVMDETQRVVELKQTRPFVPKDRGDIRLLTTQGMNERYRVASDHSRRRSKEMQN